MKGIKILLAISLLLASLGHARKDPGYDLWLRYEPIADSTLKQEYDNQVQQLLMEGNNATLDAGRSELTRAFQGMLGRPLQPSTTASLKAGTLYIARRDLLSKEVQASLQNPLQQLAKDGYLIHSIEVRGQAITVISANTDLGLLYGIFALLRRMQQYQPLTALRILENPGTDIRMLNHWDNLDRSVERGYAGFSIWNWHTLPEYLDSRYTDYARANASVGINAASLTNVNANAHILTPHYLEKVQALAGVFRPYGIRVFLTARFSAPIEIGGLETADPLDPAVRKWWIDKAVEIYKLIPDFGGFLVKANSEGQPGPQNYGRTHVDGANMLAEAVAPFNGTVIWRAFVYSEHDQTDRARQAYAEFVPYDGQFLENVIIQVKNGPIDFQPREPFHPMFGAMPKTPLMMEFQITQEYLGFATHLVFLPKLFEEVLQADTYRKGKGSIVAKVIDGSLHGKTMSGMAGVANIGTDPNWTGHPFGQANWYGFGRLAWDPYLSAATIAKEWLKLTFTNDKEFVEPMTELLLQSRETVVKYMNPLGLHHIFDTGHHYGPGPWVGNLSRPEWNPVYYHQADTLGIGFDRTASGSNALEQYAPEVAALFGDLTTCPETYLLWFHHLPWDYKLQSGQSLWEGIAGTYQDGVEEVMEMQKTWLEMAPYVDDERHRQVEMLLGIQLKESRWWRDACLLYFKQFSKKPLPEGVPAPAHDLDYYQSLKFPYAPGIRPRWD